MKHYISNCLEVTPERLNKIQEKIDKNNLFLLTRYWPVSNFKEIKNHNCDENFETDLLEKINAFDYYDIEGCAEIYIAGRDICIYHIEDNGEFINSTGMEYLGLYFEETEYKNK